MSDTFDTDDEPMSEDDKEHLKYLNAEAMEFLGITADQLRIAKALDRGKVRKIYKVLFTCGYHEEAYWLPTFPDEEKPLRACDFCRKEYEHLIEIDEECFQNIHGGSICKDCYEKFESKR